LLPEGLRIGKRIESGGYLGYKFTVAESLDIPISSVQADATDPEANQKA
jgi:hypothetical protein